MAYDISLDRTSPLPAPELVSFEEFHENNVDLVGAALALSCRDQDLAAEAHLTAMSRAAQRWKFLSVHPNPAGWAINAGLERASKVVRDRPPSSMNTATGGYVRGLALPAALDALPLSQRAALVQAIHLGWSDQDIASGAEVDASAIRMRRTRGLSFLAHHLGESGDDVVAILGEEFATHRASVDLPAVGVHDARRRGRRRTFRNRAGALMVAVLVIVLGGGLFRLGTRPEPVVTGPQPVLPPTNSSDWFDPVGDGQGGFVALNTSRASRFVSSADGETWFDEATWNSRAVDLRTEVTGFERTGGRYVATIEAAGAISSFVAPFVATSTDLDSWSVRQLPIEEPPDDAGLRTGFEIVAVAAAGPHVLVSVRATDEIDHQFYGIAPGDVCVEETTTTRLVFHRCDGSVVEVDLPATTAGSVRLFVATERDDFVEVDLPAEIDARSIQSFGDGFAAVELATGRALTSPDGRTWNLAVDGGGNRQILIAGDRRGSVLAIVPEVTGWRSLVFENEGGVDEGVLPIDLDPVAIWSVPELAVGPAGWALFVSTSRPWERADVTPGWAVDNGVWIVSRQPDSELVSVQAKRTSTRYRFIESGPHVVRGPGESLMLMHPVTGEVVADVTQDQIDQSRRAAGDDEESRAIVLFSPDGVSWRVIWESSKDAWFGTLAVGDDEVLLSGTRLPGRPIRIALDGQS